ncbi:YmaF family protein [Guptibacillus hwajinpoensis]|uniref:YmaF family protein n=1 Tax=Guptibacillus hwajinpoensis TaxID=208199 RepID=UPI001CFD376D|nr:YmaF family protein [Pseudalkalibacillus hwajinpoensis]WLR58621.1 YmaF family protein [Pseudalkalibacillus hwajinpoensis]
MSKGVALPEAHSHYFHGSIEKRYNHHHLSMIGFSFPVNGSSFDQHVHRIEGITVMEQGHQHRYSVQSSPPITLPGGGHYHTFSGETISKEKHEHYFSGQTSPPIGNPPLNW